MYPKNNATPPAIDLGQILLLADGTIQTTGASVRVRIGTGAWGAGAGTLACDTTSGIWTYAPTQAETNADYFIVAAYKADCSALSKTVITSDSSVSGRVYVQTNGDKTGYSLTQAFPSNFASLAITVGGAVTAGTVSDKTGYALSASGLASITSWTVNVTGNVSGSVGSVTNAVTVGTINPNAVNASALASDAVTEIQAGLATSTQVNNLANNLPTEAY